MAKKRGMKSTANSSEESKVYAEEEQGILPEENSEERELKIKQGEKEKDVYTEEGREALEEDDEIEPWEEGFAKGASGAGQLGKDALTGEPLMDVDDVIEAEIDEKIYRFVSRENAEKFRKKKILEKKKKH